jgi:hypothetical protein
MNWGLIRLTSTALRILLTGGTARLSRAFSRARGGMQTLDLELAVQAETSVRMALRSGLPPKSSRDAIRLCFRSAVQHSLARLTSVGRIHFKHFMWLLPISFLQGAVCSGSSADAVNRSAWDERLLAVELGDVDAKADGPAGAWHEMGMKYLLRANMYMDAAAMRNTVPFAYRKAKATGKDLFDAFLTAYPEFTYTQDAMTGIVWFHPRSVKYDDILVQKVKVAPAATCVPMYTDIWVPLCTLLAPHIVDSRKVSGGLGVAIDPSSTSALPILYSWCYDVSVPEGVYSVREILDLCCVANPTKAFLVQPHSAWQGALVIALKNLVSADPLSFPRAEAVRFWELNVGTSTNRAPSYAEVRVTMSNADPGKRCAASLYVEASMRNYVPINMVDDAAGSEQAVWTALGMQYARWRGPEDASFLTSMFERISDDLQKIENPNLALLALLQLSREKQGSSYLEVVVSNHSYSELEIAAIKPELVRMARSSRAVRDRLKQVRSRSPELSPEALDELANTNWLTLAPAGQN